MSQIYCLLHSLPLWLLSVPAFHPCTHQSTCLIRSNGSKYSPPVNVRTCEGRTVWIISTSCSHGTLLCCTTFLFTYSLPSLTRYTLALGPCIVLPTFLYIYIGYLKSSARVINNDEAYDGKEDVRPSKRKEQKAAKRSVTTGDKEVAQRPTINSVMDDDDRL